MKGPAHVGPFLFPAEAHDAAMRILIHIALLTALGSCATLNEAECQTGDWHTIGYEDGAQGRLPEYLSNHREACAEFGIAPNLELYLSGRELGLLEYCTPQRAYTLGRNGRTLANVCPAAQRATLSAANAHGQEYHRLTREISRLEQDIDDYQDELSDIRGKTNGASVLSRSLRSSISSARFEILQLRARRAQYEDWT